MITKGKENRLIVAFLCLIGGISHAQLNLDIDFSKAYNLNKNVYGLNSAATTQPYTYEHPAFVEKYNELGKPFFRFPGGTYANYYDWQTGYFMNYPNGSKNDRKRVESWNPTIKKRKGDIGGYGYKSFYRFVEKTNANYTLVLNISGKTADETKLWMEEIKELGQTVEYVELGNELYFGVYKKLINDITEYLELSKAHTEAVHSVFPDAKIGVIIPSQVYTNESFLNEIAENEETEKAWFKRQFDWYKLLEKENFFDAVIIHLYSELGMNSDIKSTKEYIPFIDAYHNSLSHADNKLETGLDVIKKKFNDKEIWVTEYHVGGFAGLLRKYELRHTFLGGLFAANFLLELFSEPMVTMASWHSMIQMLKLPPQKSYNSPLIPHDKTFETNVNYHAFKMFSEPVNNSNKFVPITVDGTKEYSANGGKHTGTYNDVTSGLFLAEKKGYLMIINKSKNEYVIQSNLSANIDGIEKQLNLEKATIFEPNKEMNLEIALEDKVNFSISKNDKIDKLVKIPPFSITTIELSFK